jgi:RHH-type proline utilization regulon transcriptional repressor/proline dehydrogenase/delta 1-pyrroline-5-carboxylate dehydrogenase
VLVSAFASAGQRCSALRVLLLQEDIAERAIELVLGAMAELRLGDPSQLSTDVGPLINQAACATLEAYIAGLRRAGRRVHSLPLARHGLAEHAGCFFAPHLVEIDSLDELQEEHFGPVLHVVRYPATQLDDMLEQLADLGYGLTLGIQSRIRHHQEKIIRRCSIGNIYVNRNIIGAVVGVQPFGGCGMSGTGPKSGGPHYLQRFATERTVTVNTTAQGGNIELLRDSD